MALPARSHRITLDEGAALTKRYRAAKISDEKAGAFHKDQVLELLNQQGCVALRIYFAQLEDAAPALVLVGMDKEGKDQTGGVILEKHYPCPPYCDDGSALSV